MIDRFTRENLQAIRADLDAALATVAAKHGVQFKLKAIRFEAQSFRATVEAAVGTDPADAERVAFAQHTAFAPALRRAGYGAEFRHGNRTYTLAGYRSRRKYPVLARWVDNGKLYMLPYEAVERAFPAEQPSLTEAAPPARTGENS